MEENITEYVTYETYTCFRNVDKSILKMNPVIEKYGYSFHAISLKQLEESFSQLFHLPKEFISKYKVRIEGSTDQISHEFYKLLHQWGTSAVLDKVMIMLKKTEDFDQEIVNKQVDISKAAILLEEARLFSDNLVIQCRMFKSGDIETDTTFQIAKTDRHVASRHNKRPGVNRTLGTFSLRDEEVIKLETEMASNFAKNEKFDLALSNFILSYSINDMRLRFITLMTCLESLFNLGGDQVAHIVSRHLSIVISANETEFKANYKHIKKLYNIRSKIVHGDNNIKLSNQIIIELEEICRNALKFCIQVNLKKDELFDHLNSRGYN